MSYDTLDQLMEYVSVITVVSCPMCDFEEAIEPTDTYVIKNHLATQHTIQEMKEFLKK